MDRVVIIGNSGAGKSTLARRLVRMGGHAHLDLDSLAWEPRVPPVRRPLSDSAREISAFVTAHGRWVIEGCYADLLAIPLPRCTRLVFLNPGVDACIENARARPWEAHKYPSKEAQDANLGMLIGWIRDYARRTDEFSLGAHRSLFDGFGGDKIELTSVEEVSAFPDRVPPR